MESRREKMLRHEQIECDGQAEEHARTDIVEQPKAEDFPEIERQP